MYPKIKGYYPEIIDYFPEYEETSGFIPPKKYMWDIFSTRDSNIANRFISHSLKERNQEEKEGERTVEVSEDVLNQLHAAHYFSKKKGKALFMLKASKDLGTIKRKRKKSIASFDPFNNEEEKKEHKGKRAKFDDESNQKITDWLITKRSKKEKKDKRDKKERKEAESQNNDNMNIDMESLRLNNPFIKK